MATTAWKYANSATEVLRSGGHSWADIIEATRISDGVNASVAVAPNGTTNALRVQSFGFTTSDVPAGAAILGVEVAVRHKSDVQTALVIDSVYLVIGGVNTGDKKGDTVLGTSHVETTYGSTSDAWSSGITAADVITPGFGVDVVLQSIDFDPSTGMVDSVRVRITYDESSGGGGDTTPPIITSSPTHTVDENTPYSSTATANETVTWAKGGSDASLVTLNASTGFWSVAAQDFETKPVVNFTLTATDTAGNATTQNIVLTINDVPEGGAGATPQLPVFGSSVIVQGTGALTFTLPAFSAGDRILWFVETANETVATPIGLVEVAGSPQGTGTAASVSATRLSVFTRVMQTGDVAPTFADSGDHNIGCVANVGPCEIDIAAGSVVSTSGTVIPLPDITTTGSNRRLLAVATNMVDAGGARYSGWTNGFTEIYDANGTAGNGGGIGIATKEQVSAGPVGATQVSHSVTTLAAAMMIALYTPGSAPLPTRRAPRHSYWI